MAESSDFSCFIEIIATDFESSHGLHISVQFDKFFLGKFAESGHFLLIQSVGADCRDLNLSRREFEAR